MPSEFDEIMQQAKPSETTVRIPLRGDLVAEHQLADQELKALGDWTASNLAESDPRVPLALEIQRLEQEIAASERVFRFRALGRRKYRELLEQHPSDVPGERWDDDTFPRALISACCISPEMTPTDVDRLFDVLNDGSVETLFLGAYSVNEGVSRVPFSERASKVTARLEQK